ncbi:MAG: T9SS type A sorting domain-containing protein, partial [Bacteroidota bacterium]
SAPYDVAVYNVVGQQLYRATWQQGEVRIAVADWPAGTYFIAWRSVANGSGQQGGERHVTPLVIAR